jgi:hypothetical protein
VTAPEPLAPEVRALALASMRQRIEAEEKLVRAEFSTALMAGTTLRFRSPLDDEPLGCVLRTDPKTEWRITNREVLVEHLAGFEGCVEVVTYVAVPSAGLVRLDEQDELYRVLSQHADHLLVEQVEVKQEAIEAALAQSKATGQPAAPGIEKVRPSGSVQVRPDKGAAAAVQRMFAAGALSWELLIPDEPKAVAS